MATSVIYSDDQDDLIMDFERESDTDTSEDESSDDDSGEVGEGDRAPEAAGEAEGTGEGEEEAVVGFGAWQYEPLPYGRPGENVGDARPSPDENRLNTLDC